MSESATRPQAKLPGSATPYVLRSGDGACNLLAGQVVRTLAGVDETAGAFGAVVCDCPLDPRPIPMHHHEREHDTWFCTRGKLQVWCEDRSVVLAPGDFAYVKPFDRHSYQSRAPHSQFFGIVAPGGWEEFFFEAGEPWASAAFPPTDRPFNIGRIIQAQDRFDVVRTDNACYVDPTPLEAGDRQLPDGVSSYFLEAAFGTRRLLFDHLSTALLTPAQNEGRIDMRTIEAGRGAMLPPHRHLEGHLFLYVLEGTLALSLDGEQHDLTGGDAVNIPAGTTYSTEVRSGSARWIAATGNSPAQSFWDGAGRETDAHCFPHEPSAPNDVARCRQLQNADVVFG